MDVGCLSLSLRSHSVTACLSLSPIVAGFLSLSPMVTGCLSLFLWSHRVATCLSLSPIVAGFLSPSLPVPWYYCMSLTVSNCCWLSHTLSLIPWSCFMSLTESHGCWLSLAVCLVPWSFWISITVSYSSWLSLTKSQWVATCLSLSFFVASCL